MRPILFEWGPVVVPSFGFFMAIGFLLGSFVVWRRLRDDYDEEKLVSLTLAVGMSALVGARMAAILVNWEKFSGGLVRWLSLVDYPGLSFYGGVAGFFVGAWLFALRARWKLWEVWDGLVEGGLWFTVLASLGGFLSGTGVGKTTNLAWGISFPGIGGARHPVMLYLAILAAFLLLILEWVKRNYRKFAWYKSGRRGFVGLFGFLGLFVAIFVLEGFKDGGVYLWSFKVEQYISMGVLACTVVSVYKISGRKLKEDKKDVVLKFGSVGKMLAVSRNIVRRKKKRHE